MLDFQAARTHPQLGKAFSVLLDADDWDPREFEGIQDTRIDNLEKSLFEGQFRIPPTCREFYQMAGKSYGYFTYDDFNRGFWKIESSVLREDETVFAQANQCEEPPYIPQYAFTFFRTEHSWAYLDLELGDASPTWWINTYNAPYHGQYDGNFAGWLLALFQRFAERHRKAIEGKEERRRNVNRVRNRVFDLRDRWAKLNEEYQSEGFEKRIHILDDFARNEIYGVYRNRLSIRDVEGLLPHEMFKYTYGIPAEVIDREIAYAEEYLGDVQKALFPKYKG